MVVLKWIGLSLLGLIVLIVLAAFGLSFIGSRRLEKTRLMQVETITIPTDQAAVLRGEHLVNSTCKSCHGAELAGLPLLDDPAIGMIYASNLTGLGATHSDLDLVRAIRHAVGKDGRQLMVMPSESFIHFSAEDLGAVIAYLKTVPPAGEQHPAPQIALMGRILLALGMFGDVFPAEIIDHSMAFHAMPQVGANIEYGEYLARFCQSCHGEDLSGKQPPDPESPYAPNLTPSGSLGIWDEQDFIETMRTGVTPSRRQLDPNFMPWESFGKFDDDELRAIWMYLSTLPYPGSQVSQ